jgi:hypothetical protein
MEDRLRRSSQQTSTRGSIAQVQANSQQRQMHNAHYNEAPPPPLPKDEHMEKSRSRPGTARQGRHAPSAGDMPPTPVASEGEYELVDKDDLDDVVVNNPHRSRPYPRH